MWYAEFIRWVRLERSSRPHRNKFSERAMSIRSAGIACFFTLLGLIGTSGCHPKPPPEPGAVVVRSEQMDEPREQGVIDAPVDATYACYKAGVDEPLETFTLKKGEKLGFEVVQSDQGRGRTVPVLYGIAGKDRFVLPIGDKYVWKRK